jgi:hypothetical protein
MMFAVHVVTVPFDVVGADAFGKTQVIDDDAGVATVNEPSDAVVACTSPVGSVGGGVAPYTSVGPTITVAPAIPLPRS